MKTEPVRLAIIGSTGSIGRSALEVVREHRGRFEVVALAAGSNVEALAEQVREFAPRSAGVSDRAAARVLERLCPGLDVRTGADGVASLAGLEDVDVVLLAAVRAGKRLALATKEVLVAAGALVLEEASVNGAQIVPVDSEHCAIFQCMQAAGARGSASVERLVLTASGGPFRLHERDALERVTPAEALAHPTWRMGSKISIDSATLMNKGLEVIEAHWLFDVPAERIDVVIHPQSVVHSLVEFCDGSMVAQLSTPDMRMPILYALTYPERWALKLPRLNLAQERELTFFTPNFAMFPCLLLAYEALKMGGTAPTVLNAANEAAVRRFLAGEIKFLDIPRLVEKKLSRCTVVAEPKLEDIMAADAWGRELE